MDRYISGSINCKNGEVSGSRNRQNGEISGSRNRQNGWQILYHLNSHWMNTKILSKYVSERN